MEVANGKFEAICLHVPHISQHVGRNSYDGRIEIFNNRGTTHCKDTVPAGNIFAEAKRYACIRRPTINALIQIPELITECQTHPSAKNPALGPRLDRICYYFIHVGSGLQKIGCILVAKHHTAKIKEAKERLGRKPLWVMMPQFAKNRSNNRIRRSVSKPANGLVQGI